MSPGRSAQQRNIQSVNEKRKRDVDPLLKIRWEIPRNGLAFISRKAAAAVGRPKIFSRTKAKRTKDAETNSAWKPWIRVSPWSGDTRRKNAYKWGCPGDQKAVGRSSEVGVASTEPAIE